MNDFPLKEEILFCLLPLHLWERKYPCLLSNLILLLIALLSSLTDPVQAKKLTLFPFSFVYELALKLNEIEMCSRQGDF